MSSVEAPINPKILAWAREQSGYQLEDVVEKINQRRFSIESIQSWEDGEEQLLFSDLEKLANLYKRPTALFFFSAPPEENIQKEFRGVENYISPKVRYLVRKAKIFQINLSELLGDVNPEKRKNNYLLDKINNEMRQIESNNRDRYIKIIAREVRDLLGIDLQKQKSWENNDVALKAWRNTLEEKGIFIFKDAFRENEEEFKKDGFCIYDKEYPIIYLNNSTSKNRQIFTIFHELAHLILGRNGISFRSQEITASDREEIFCNKFAGEFLVPYEDIQEINSPTDMQNILRLAEIYKVSREVICRRLLDNNKINEQGYYRFIGNEQKNSGSPKKKKKDSGSYANNTKAYLGERYINIVQSKYYSKHVSKKQFAGYLGIKISSIRHFEI